MAMTEQKAFRHNSTEISAHEHVAHTIGGQMAFISLAALTKITEKLGGILCFTLFFSFFY